MKNYSFIFLVLVFAFFLNACNMKRKNTKQKNSIKTENLYFAQKPPDTIPEIFAPGIISVNGRYEHGISFSPDLDEVYFSSNKKGGLTDIYFSKLEGGEWTEVQKAKFTKGRKDEEMHPYVSFNGEKIYFVALNADNTDTKIWFVNRLKDSWSDAEKLNSPINDDEVFYPNETKDGDLLYFNVSKRKTYYASYRNGEFLEGQEMEIEFGVHGFISPSQDYLLVNARNKEDDQRKSDIYVYFKKKDRTWSKPISLGKEVNSNFSETCPSITPDGKYLFFSRYNEEGGLSNFYWVSTEVINKVRPVDF
ncbi:MAG: hypothetical protein AAGJ12_14060 [Bacteroidota bacterium]